MSTAMEVTRGDTKRRLTVSLESVPGTPLDLTGGSGMLEMASLECDVARSIVAAFDGAPAAGKLYFDGLGNLITKAELGARNRAEFRGRVKFTTGDGKIFFSDLQLVTVVANPLEDEVLEIVFSSGTGRENPFYFPAGDGMRMAAPAQKLITNAERLVLFSASGEGLVREISLVTDSVQAAAQIPLGVLLEIQYDGEATPSVSVPLSSLLGLDPLAYVDVLPNLMFKTPFFSVTSRPRSVDNTRQYSIAPLESPNGSRTIFTLPSPYLPLSTSIYLNGLKQDAASQAWEYIPTSGTIQFATPPTGGSVITVDMSLNLVAYEGFSFVLNYPMPYSNGIEIALKAPAGASTCYIWSQVTYQTPLPAVWNRYLRFMVSRSNENVPAGTTPAGTIRLTTPTSVVGTGTAFSASYVGKVIYSTWTNQDILVLSVEDATHLTVSARDTMNATLGVDDTFSLHSMHTFLNRPAGERGYVAAIYAAMDPPSDQMGDQLESNPRIFLDGHADSDWQYTGTEDMFTGAFFWRDKFQGDQGGIVCWNEFTGRICAYRLYRDIPIGYVDGIVGKEPNAGLDLCQENWTTVFYVETVPA